MAADATGQWYWCFKHSAVEPPDGCANTDRLGPYASPEEARNWRERVHARNEAWDDEEE